MEQREMAAIYDRMKNTVYRTALAYCRNVQDAEDITHDVFLARFRREEPFPDEEQEKAWLLRVTINRCKNLLKSFRRRFTVPLDDAAHVCITQDEHAVWDAVNALPAKYRIVICSIMKDTLYGKSERSPTQAKQLFRLSYTGHANS